MMSLMPCPSHPSVEDRLTRCTRCGDTFCPDCIVEIGGHPYCAPCKDEAMRNLRSGLPPELAHPMEMASLGRRFLAIFVDNMIVAIPAVILFFAIALPSGIFKEMGSGKPSGAFFAFEALLTLGVMAFGIAYEGMMLSNGGQTIGKKLVKIKVVTPDGKDITKGQAWTRALTRHVLNAILCLGIVDCLVAFGQDRAAIHDHAARTRVIDWNG